MTLLRLVRSFGLRRGLALWLLPEFRSAGDPVRPGGRVYLVGERGLEWLTIDRETFTE